MPYFVNDDLNLYYDENGKGELLVILPGNTASSLCHKDDLEYFGKNYHAVSPDFRGVGRSPRIASWSNWWDKCVEDVRSLVESLGRKKSLIMGTSGGGNIALLFAIKYPEYVSAIIADSCAEIYSPENLREEVEGRSQKTEEQVGFWSFAHGDDWEDVVKSDNNLLLDLAKRGGDIFDGALKDIKCPVLLTGSLKDSFIPDLGLQHINMAKQIENSRLFLATDGDHPFMWTAPNTFRSLCNLFLREIKGE